MSFLLFQQGNDIGKRVRLGIEKRDGILLRLVLVGDHYRKTSGPVSRENTGGRILQCKALFRWEVQGCGAVKIDIRFRFSFGNLITAAEFVEPVQQVMSREVFPGSVHGEDVVMAQAIPLSWR